eukprot:75712_1
MVTFFLIYHILFSFHYELCQGINCLGEFQLCDSGDCTMSPKSCGICSSGQYICPISKHCINNVSEYINCPMLKNTHLDWTLPLSQRLQFLLNNLTLTEKYTQLTNDAPEIYRLGIPSYNWLNDDVHGVRNHHAIQFANGIGLGATWSKNDLFDAAQVIALEARSLHNALVHNGNRGRDQNGDTITLYTPNINLVRDPRWGRGQECFSEDPRLSGHLAQSFVNGLQQQLNNQTYYLTIACCKHFASFDLENNGNQSRHQFNAIVNAVNFAETYSPVFHQCIVAAKGQSLMCSYNAVNFVPSCANKNMLTDVLRNQWNFNGFVVSDYDAMEEIYSTHHYVNNSEQAVAVSLNAGVDQEGGGTTAINEIPNALKNGLITMNEIDTAFYRLFRARILLGLFDPPTFVKYNQLKNDSTVEGDAHFNISRRISAHLMTLYKNKNYILPLNNSNISGIAMIGPQSISTQLFLGDFSQYPDHGIVTIIQAFREEIGENITAECNDIKENIIYNLSYLINEIEVYSVNECCSLCFEDDECFFWSFILNYTNSSNFCITFGNNINLTDIENLNNSYSGKCASNFTSKIHNVNGCNTVTCETNEGFNAALQLISKMYNNNALDAVFIGLGLNNKNEGVGHDRQYIELPGLQNELVSTIYNYTYPKNIPLICYLIHGGTLALGQAANQCDAIIDCWYPGMTGAYGFSDVIFGRISPAGRAPVTSYKSTSYLPETMGEMDEYYGNGLTYRYFKNKTGVLYPFGYGLSYTKFKYNSIQLNVSNDNNEIGACDIVKVTVNIQNIGRMDGEEVVQLYIKQPNASVPVPHIRLADFDRVFIKQNESVDIDLILTPRYRSVVYNQNDTINWYKPEITIEKGIIYLFVGGGQPDFYNGGLEGFIYVNETQIFYKCNNQD